jgi:hypothetical protein
MTTMRAVAELTRDDEIALEEIYRVMRLVEGPSFDDSLDTDHFEIQEVDDPPQRLYWFGSRSLELHPEGVVEGTIEGGLIYFRSITRDGVVRNMRVEPLRNAPPN